MHKNMLTIICCPYHKDTSFGIQARREEGDEIVEGILTCQKCKRIFPIIDKIPYLLTDDLKSQNTRISDFFVTNEAFIKTDQFLNFKESKTDSNFDWMPGERTWQPDIISRLITNFRTKKTGNLIDAFFESGGFSLDIGCGESARGKVNVDIYLPSELPRNFVMASAEYLPFQSGIFDLVFSSYVIEHCLNPASFINELVRCSKEKVLILTDNSQWIGDLWFMISGNGRIFHDEHYYAWSVKYLENLARRLGYKSSVQGCNLSPSYIVTFLSKFGTIPRIGPMFFRDLKIEIYTNN